jgi:hypothetical protein
MSTKQSRSSPTDVPTPISNVSGRAATRMAHHASNCRWAVPTIFLPAPYWWEAEDRPWACVRDGTPRVMETTEECADCPFWEPREAAPVTVPTTTTDVLRNALEDVYRLRATCQKAIEAFGRIQPFTNFREDEARHVRALRALLNRLGTEAPPDTWPARVSSPDTLAEACATAGRAELQRQALYERLLQVVDDPAARRILRRIQAQSRGRHLPAFRRCFSRALKPIGRPRGVRRGRGTD